MNSRKSPVSAFARFALALAPIALPAVAQEEPDEQTINWVCNLLTGGGQSGQNECQGFVLRYGDAKEVLADRAISSNLEFNRGEKQLVGNVRIRLNSALLTADSATILLLADEIESFELIGNPVVLTDVIEDNGSPIRAEAHTLAYDRASDTVIMRGDVSFAYGTEGNPFATCFLRYGLTAKQFEVGQLGECGSSMSLDPATFQDAGDEQSDGP
jgi:lipopolysaccharide export system protein LptA